MLLGRKELFAFTQRAKTPVECWFKFVISNSAQRPCTVSKDLVIHCDGRHRFPSHATAQMNSFVAEWLACFGRVRLLDQPDYTRLTRDSEEQTGNNFPIMKTDEDIGNRFLGPGGATVHPGAPGGAVPAPGIEVDQPGRLGSRSDIPVRPRRTRMSVPQRNRLRGALMSFRSPGGQSREKVPRHDFVQSGSSSSGTRCPRGG